MRSRSPRSKQLLVFLLALVAPAWLGSTASRALACDDAGRPCCDFCRMLIEDHAHGGEARTPAGERLVFDATECMAAYDITNPGELREMRSMDFERPGTWIDARTAHYLQSDSLKSPMGVNLTAFASLESAEVARKKNPGEILTLDEAIAVVRKRWYPKPVSTPTPASDSAATPAERP